MQRRRVLWIELAVLMGIVGSGSTMESSARGDAGTQASSETKAGALSGGQPRDLSAMLDTIRKRFNAPGVAAAAIINGNLVAVGNAGVRGLDSKIAVGDGDRSLVGSCGKAWTRLLIARLADRGLLGWDSTIGELLADVKMRDVYRSVTIADILSHRGGLQPYTEITPQDTPILFDQSGTAHEQRAAFVAHLLMEKPATKPKSRFLYSNAGYGLLGYIAECLTNKSFEQAMRDEVFTPLGMSSTTVGMPQEVRNPPGWTGHMRTPKGFEAVVPPREGLPALMPAGFMSCTIRDFAKISDLLCDIEAKKPTSFLSPATVLNLPELRPGGGGEGGILFGGDGHYTAAFALWPSKGLAIVVQSNAGSSDGLCAAMINAVRDVVAPDIQAKTGGPTADDPDRPRYGFQILAENESWVVAEVFANSRAAKGGLLAGDRIIAINGTQLAKMPEDDRMAEVRKSPLKLDVERDGKSVRVTLTLR